MFWYRSRGQIRGRKWFSPRHSGKAKGPERLSLASQKIRSKLPRASFPLLTLDHRFPAWSLWPAGRQEETRIRMHGRDICRGRTRPCKETESAESEPAPLIPFFKRPPWPLSRPSTDKAPSSHRRKLTPAVSPWWMLTRGQLTAHWELR